MYAQNNKHYFSYIVQYEHWIANDAFTFGAIYWNAVEVQCIIHVDIKIKHSRTKEMGNMKGKKYRSNLMIDIKIENCKLSNIIGDLRRHNIWKNQNISKCCVSIQFAWDYFFGAALI